MPSSAAEYFAAFESLTAEQAYERIADLPNQPEPVQENEWRDFKQYFAGSREKDAKEAWSELLAAFANTGGGVVIWGVEAHRHATLKVDCVTGVAPIDDPGALADLLRRLVLDATNPPVGGVEFKIARDDGKGFIVAYIPESTNKPHRSELVKNKPYLIRVGDSCIVPNPALLRAMFFPQARKDVLLGISIRPFTVTQSDRSFIYLDVRNVGKTSVRDAAISVATSQQCTFKQTQSEILSSSDDSTTVTWTLRKTLHPGETNPFAEIRIRGREAVQVTVTLVCLPSRNVSLIAMPIAVSFLQRRRSGSSSGTGQT